MHRITSVQNSYIKELRRLKTKKGRAESGLFLVEGEKCVQEALVYAEVSAIVTTEEDRALNFEAGGMQTHLVSDAVMQAISDVKTPQGILAAVRRAPASLPSLRGHFVALEDIADPQNVGTIIRTADAAGFCGVLLSNQCADHTSPKAVRAAMGSIFHLPVVVCEDFYARLQTLRENGVTLIGTHLRGSCKFVRSANACIVIGNEARGMSETAASLCDNLYKIPMKGKAESLNAAVAAGIAIYQLV